VYKLKKSAPKVNNELRPKKVPMKKVEPNLFSSGDESETPELKPKKSALRADNELRPKKVPMKKVELSLPSCRDESDASIPMLKIGPPKKAWKLPSAPKSKPTIDSSVFNSSDLDHSTPKQIVPPIEYELLTEDEPLLKEDENQPIALTGLNVNCGSEESHYLFLRTLSPLEPYQTLIKSIQTLPKAFISSTERKNFQPWANWD
jgi:hypothetical protein